MNDFRCSLQIGSQKHFVENIIFIQLHTAIVMQRKRFLGNLKCKAGTMEIECTGFLVNIVTSRSSGPELEISHSFVSTTHFL